MLRIRLTLVLAMSCSISAFAVDGIAIGVHSNSTNAFGLHKGNVRAHLIKGSSVKEYKDVYTGGNARCVSISPSANRFAFIRSDGKICVGNMEENSSVTPIASIPADAWIDWPVEDYIYFTNKWQGDTLKRVPSNGGSVESVATGLQSAMQFSIAPSLTRGTAVTCCYSARSWERSGNTITFKTNMGGCGAGISPNGAYFSNNQGDHASVKIWNFDGSLYKEWNTKACGSAGSYWNRLRWSANSNDWVCFTQGGGGSEPYQMTGYHNIVLYNINNPSGDHVQVTNNSNGTYDEADDFWVGDPYSVFGSKPRIGLSPASLTFNTSESAANDPDSQDVFISNTGSAGTVLPTLSASSDAGWLTVEVIGGNRKIVNRVLRSAASAGVHQATVTVSGADVASATYTVTLVYKAAQVFSTVRVTPENGSVAPGSTLQFSAAALDQDDEAMGQQPAFTWSTSGGGTINQSGVFSAFSTTGGPYSVTAEATISGVTKSGTATVMVQSLLFRMNCGGEEINDWMAEQYSTGASYTFSGTVNTQGVTDPAPAEVYQTCRHQSPSYTFPSNLVPDGKYKVRLHFNDGVGPAGTRRMNVSIEGNEVLSNFDIVAVAGGTNKAVVREFDVIVDDGNGMTIALAQGSGNDAFISGIEVFAAGGEAPKVQVIAPAEGDQFMPGDVLTVQWKVDPNAVAAVLIRISSDGFLSDELISPSNGSIDMGGSDMGSYEWTIPADFPYGQYQIRVADYYDDGTKNAVSGIFSIGSTEIGRRNAACRATVGISSQAYRNIVVSIPFEGHHTIEFFTLDGANVRRLEGNGPATYTIADEKIPAGVYLVKVHAGIQEIQRRVTLIGR